LLVTFVGLMEGEGTLKSCPTDLRKYDHMAHSKYNRLHLPPLHDVESTSRTTFFEAAGDDVGWLSDSTTSCASTIKSDIIEAWKKRKTNHRKEAWKRRKKRWQLKLDRLKPVLPRLKPAHRLKPALTLAIVGLPELAISWP
jgi:hypothetical protein